MTAGLWMAALLVTLISGAVPQPAGDEPPRHLIYLHGRIVQVRQSPRPEHPRFGPYELEKILGALRERGFEVTGEMRPREATMESAAGRVVRQVTALLEAGVPEEQITVVGASMGAGIALLASARLQRPGLRLVTLGNCLSRSAAALEERQGRGPLGRILSIREASDGATEPCPAWEGRGGDGPGPVVRERVLETGLEHGFLYRPLPQWVEPAVAWAERAESAGTGAAPSPRQRR